MVLSLLLLSLYYYHFNRTCKAIFVYNNIYYFLSSHLQIDALSSLPWVIQRYHIHSLLKTCRRGISHILQLMKCLAIPSDISFYQEQCTNYFNTNHIPLIGKDALFLDLSCDKLHRYHLSTRYSNCYMLISFILAIQIRTSHGFQRTSLSLVTKDVCLEVLYCSDRRTWGNSKTHKPSRQ